eukprot:TRINITY_DN6535_c0_g1_i1.p1 TRINITY_DN6535_c0_g1~~TRINITY_DN6535_c0_g1_i1.p1  ORF type:complete len:138 (-),score=35.00 TRINITY_DN6535_c0_g1_i1:644-1057(-)
MAKSRSKKKTAEGSESGAASMDISSEDATAKQTSQPQSDAMDTTGSGAQGHEAASKGKKRKGRKGGGGGMQIDKTALTLGVKVGGRAAKRGAQQRKAVKLRQQKALERAVTTLEKRDEKQGKQLHKQGLIHAAKTLY